MNIRRAGVILSLLIFVLIGASVAQAQDRTHVVQPGENLFRIALRYGLTVDQLAFANGITNPERIYAGQILVIPSVGGAQGDASTYTVVDGDTLFSIARRQGTTVDALVAANGLADPNVLSVGQVLQIPSGGQQAPATPPVSTAQPSADQTVTYTVQPGDTLSRIALRYGTTYQQLALLNGLNNPDLIYAGDTLFIHKAGGAPSTTMAPTLTTTIETPVGTVSATPSETTMPIETPTTVETAVTPTTPTITETVTVEPTDAQTETVTPPSDTPTPTPTETQPSPTTEVVPSITPTRITPDVTVPPDAPNLLSNPGFEGATREVGFSTVKVFEGWEPYYCDEPYTGEKCPALRQGNGNPEGLTMGRPIYKGTDTPNRVHSGTSAQQWFCAYSACRGGIYQIISTVPGATCEAGAYVQSWSAGAGSALLSALTTQDDRDNSTWFIRVDLSGGTFAFNNSLQLSRGFGYSDGIYDQYAHISYIFVATGDRVTVFFENLRLWPIANNHNWIDDAYVRCSE